MLWLSTKTMRTYPLHAASIELVINRSSPYSWLKQYGTGKRARSKNMRDKAQATTDSERIRQLENENAKLREERDILRLSLIHI